MNSKSKILYIELLNIVACFFVVLMHCTGVVFDFQSNKSWFVAMTLQTIAHAAIPVFFMCTGATLLNYNEKYSTREYAWKRIKRVFIPFLIWTAIYILWRTKIGELQVNGIKDLLAILLNNKVEYIFWYFYALIPIYLFIPILSRFMQKKNVKYILYYLALCGVMTVFLPALSHYFQLGVTPFSYLTYAQGFIAFLLLGWLLSNYSIKREWRMVIYTFGILGGLTMFLGTYFWNYNNPSDALNTYYMGYQSLGCYAMGISLFLLFKNMDWTFIEKNKFVQILVHELAQASLGIYFIQMIVIYYFNKIVKWNFYSVKYMVLGTIAIYLISAILVCLFRKIGLLTVGKKVSHLISQAVGKAGKSVGKLVYRNSFYSISFVKDSRSMIRASIISWLVCILLIASWNLLGSGGIGKRGCIVIALLIIVLNFIRIEWKKKRTIVVDVLAAVFIPFISLYLLEYINEHDLFALAPIGIWLNYLWMVVVYLVLKAVLYRTKAAVVVQLILSVFIGALNYFVTLFRDSPILPWDIYSIKLATEVAGGYSFTPTREMLVAIFVLLFVSIIFLKGRKIKYNWKRHLVLILITVIGIIGYAKYFYGTDVLDRNRIWINSWDQKDGYRTNGILVGFMQNLENIIIEKPANYSATKVEELLTEENTITSNSSMDKKPNVIVIMNESFVDYSAFGDLQTGEDITPFLHSLKENTISGQALVSTFGGGTSRSEFEFLTGLSMAFLPSGTTPYQQYIFEEKNSLASILKAEGYETVAMHPYGKSGWNREKIYPLLGFDEFIGLEDMTGIENYRAYASDFSNYEQVINRYEERDGNIFIFNITMQNHGGYNEEFENFTVDVNSGVSNDYAFNQYLSLVKKSDEALEYLIRYFERQEEPVIICFFGDHHPGIYEPVDELLKDNYTEMEQQIIRYMTPFFIWANYDIQEEEVPLTSLNYLSSMLLRESGLELPAYNQFLLRTLEEMPAISGIGFVDNNLIMHTLDDESNELKNNYEILQYYYLFDNKK